MAAAAVVGVAEVGVLAESDRMSGRNNRVTVFPVAALVAVTYRAVHTYCRVHIS